MQIYITPPIRHFVPLPLRDYYLPIIEVIVIWCFWPWYWRCVTLFKQHLWVQELRKPLYCVKVPVTVSTKEALEEMEISRIYVTLAWINYVAIFRFFVKSMELFAF